MALSWEWCPVLTGCFYLLNDKSQSCMPGSYSYSIFIQFYYYSILILILISILFYSLFDIDYYIDPGYFRLSDREVLMVVGHALAKHKVFMERMECLDFSDENERISVENLQGVCPISPAGSLHYSASQSSGINGIQK